MIPETMQDSADADALRQKASAGMFRSGGVGRSFPSLPPRVPPVQVPERMVPGVSRAYARPDYAARFRCIAGSCEDTCCQGWGVPVDQATYEKYRTDDHLKRHVGTLIVLNASGGSRGDYARMPLTNAGACGFLDAQRMCGIQKHLGEQMLSETCSTYPRAISQRGGQAEQALNLSCPEAARLVLLEPNLLGDKWLHDPDHEHYIAVRGWAEQPLRGGEAQLAVRHFALLLLADRNYPMWQRLYLLGTLVRRLRSLSGDQPVAAWCAANPRDVEQLLRDSARVAERDRLRPMMDEIAARPAEQLEMLTAILRLRLPGPPIPPRFVECLKDFELGIRCETASTEAEVLQAYADAHRRYYLPLMELHPHLLENYLTNHVFKNGYPFGRSTDSEDVEAEHLLLCVHAALAQSLLIGMAGHYREAFSLAHVVKLIQSLAKTLEHSKHFLDQIAEFVRERGLGTPRGMAMLLRQEECRNIKSRGQVRSPQLYNEGQTLLWQSVVEIQTGVSPNPLVRSFLPSPPSSKSSRSSS